MTGFDVFVTWCCRLGGGWRTSTVRDWDTGAKGRAASTGKINPYAELACCELCFLDGGDPRTIHIILVKLRDDLDTRPGALLLHVQGLVPHREQWIQRWARKWLGIEVDEAGRVMG